MRKTNFLNKVYEKSSQSGNYIVEVALDKYTDIFNDWDHASFKKRDIDPDLILFLENCSEDIPLKYAVDVCFYIPKEIQDKNKEKTIINGFKTYYNFYVHIEKKNLRQSYQRIISYIFISFTFLSLSFILSGNNEIFYNTFVQGLTIGGWVFLWEAISFYFFRRRKVVYQIKTYERFAGAKVYFKYDQK